jgi:hypothetical protein
MNWRRFAWLIVILLVFTIVWAAIELKREYDRIAIAKLKDKDDPSRRLASIQKRIAGHREYIKSLEEVALWPSEEDPMSWFTQQANDSNVSIIGVEHPAVEQVPEYHYVPVKITLRGDYNPLGRFINKLERSQNMVRIDSLRIRYNEYAPEHITMELSLSYFQRIEGNEKASRPVG